MTPIRSNIMNAAKKTLAVTKKFVTDHKVALTAITTATATAAVFVKKQKDAIREVNEFLAEKGLYEEFQNRFTDMDI